MKKFILALAVLLSSCTTFKEHNKTLNFPVNTQMVISIHKLKGGNFNTLAYAEIQGNECRIYLRKYPQCLLHEVRHCFEGNWHEGRKTDEDCY